MGQLVLTVVFTESRITWETSVSVWDWSYWYGLWVGKFPSRTSIVDCTVEHQRACVLLSLVLDSGCNVTGSLKVLSHFLTWETTVIRTGSQNTPCSLVWLLSVSLQRQKDKRSRMWRCDSFRETWATSDSFPASLLSPLPLFSSLPFFSPENHLGCNSGHANVTYSLLKDGREMEGVSWTNQNTGSAWLLVSKAQPLTPRNRHISCHSLYPTTKEGAVGDKRLSPEEMSPGNMWARVIRYPDDIISDSEWA